MPEWRRNARQTMLSGAPTRNLSIVMPNPYLGMGFVPRSEAEIPPVSAPDGDRLGSKVSKFEAFTIMDVQRLFESFVIGVPIMSYSASERHNGPAYREARKARYRPG